ncbi:glycosyltransferase family 4 protein [Chryseobacterium koreense]|uniref:Glycosyltransferase n=1 Tax=Chryseobacterium koreense CCUG 49689 TaxID=1304281 RepID=A0A0J7IXL3_9FLAO|nr:glycosyltransferase family 4 protein [Chryseobacterium koreense]KMQ70554.1 glycosyltransferase [Chryseobacterium koreense CCUG 49689]MBB5334354.1 glycosyltransferase involved in cell wall biosynthesis [Chryseobacterium koreense]
MKHLVIIGTVFPEPNSTAAGKRMLQLVDFFLEQNFRISFLSAAAISENSFDLKLKGIETFSIKINDSSFERLIAELHPEIVIFDRFISEEQFGWKVSEICPDAMKILDTEDLHFLRKAREMAFKQNRNAHENNLLNDVFKREIASVLRCDLSLMISEFEMDLLTNHFNIDKSILHYLPLFAEKADSGRTFSERKNFVSIGNFLHEPNWQTVLKLKKLWPQIRKKLPDSELHIFGAYVPEKAQQLHQEKEGFLIKGRAANKEELFKNYRVLLAPIPFGAGIKGKLLESMEFGLPSVTSSIGAEGMNGNLNWNGFVCDDDSDFVEKSVQLYSDENLWTAKQKNGFAIVENRFQKKAFLSQFSLRLKEIESNLKSHRNKNFLGQILQHHTLQSAKYLGKWIEEKNK